MKYTILFFLFFGFIYSQDATSFFNLKGNWDVIQTLYSGEKKQRINTITDLFEGNGLLSYWYDENNNFVGSDVRTYEADTDRWKMTWFNGKTKKWQKTRYLKRKNDNYVALSDFEDEKGKYKERITFFNITKNSYEWRMELYRDSWNKWVTVMSYKSSRK